MKYLLISGAPNTGKTETIYDLTVYLISQGYDIVLKGDSDFITPKPSPPAKVKDFQCIIEKKISENCTKRILLNSATDNENRINSLLDFYKRNPNIDLIVSSIRDGGDAMRKLLKDGFKITSSSENIIEVPLAKITRRGNSHTTLMWYKRTVNKLVVSVFENTAL